MVRVVGSGVGDVVKHVLWVQPVALGDLHEALRAECALSVNVQALALAASHVDWELACHAERVAQLRFAGPKFSVDFGNGPSLHSTFKNRVQLLQPRNSQLHGPKSEQLSKQ